MKSLKPPSQPSPAAPPIPRRSPLPSGRQVVIVFLISLVLGKLFTPIFNSPFLIVWGRTVFISMVMLFAYSVAGSWQLRWVPRWLAQLLTLALLAPFASLIAYIVNAGGFMRLVNANNMLSGLATSTLLALIFGPVIALVAMSRERKQKARADQLQLELEKQALEKEVVDARLRLLQAQIEPHFLFNTLANVQALVESKSDNAAPVLSHLIAYLRAAMPRLHDADATLATELDLVRSYLALMHMRMPDRLRYTIDVQPEMLTLRFPAMTLLTLVENAVKHGIDPSTEGGAIEVGGKRDATGGMVSLWVADSGVGMAETAQPGTGLTNVRARLQACFGADARLELHDLGEQAERGLRVELHFHPDKNHE